MTQRSTFLAIVLGALAISSNAQATAIVDVTGYGRVCDFSGVGQNCHWSNVTDLTATITLAVNSAGPSGADVHTDGSTFVYDLDGWVDSIVEAHWGTRSFFSGPDASRLDKLRGNVSNDFEFQRTAGGPIDRYDELTAIRSSETSSGDGTTLYFGSQFSRATADLSWLNDLSFPELIGLSPEPNANNTLAIWDYSVQRPRPVEIDPDEVREGPREVGGNPLDYVGMQGYFIVQTALVRPTINVPEPASLCLFGVGIGLLGMLKRAQRKF